MMQLAPFRSALAAGEDASHTAEELSGKLMLAGSGGDLGFVYASDKVKGSLGIIVETLKEKTGVKNWIGTIGLGVIGGGEGVVDHPAIAAMIATWPKDQYALYDKIPPQPIAPASIMSGVPTAIVHVDPRQHFDQSLQNLAQVSNAYLVGGLTATRGRNFDQVAETITHGGISGVLLGPDVSVSIGVSQGCSPIGPARTISEVKDQFVTAIDGAPALQALLKDIAATEESDQRKLLLSLHVGLPVPHSDTGDYVVRNIAGINTEKGFIAVADHVEEGQKIFFCRRDRNAAAKDLTAMVKKLRSRVQTVNGALYISCCARGPNLFSSAQEEVDLVQAGLGQVPLIGFYANGEIAGERVYGYTGVLALF